MRVDTLAELVIGLYFFYQTVVQPRRYGVFLAKCALLIALFVPAIALMSEDWDDAIQGDVSVAVLISSSICVTGWVVLLDPQAPWLSILKQFGVMVLAGVTVTVSLMWWKLQGVTVGHFYYMARSPIIVMAYVARLPKDGAIILRDFLRVFYKIILEKRRPVPAVPVLDRNGNVITNITGLLV